MIEKLFERTIKVKKINKSTHAQIIKKKNKTKQNKKNKNKTKQRHTHFSRFNLIIKNKLSGSGQV